MFEKKRSSRLLTTGSGIRYWLKPSQWVCIGVILWTVFCGLIFPVYRGSFIIVQMIALYLLIMESITKIMDDHKE